MTLRIVALAVAVLVVSCGGKDGGSTAAPSPTTTGVTIAGTTDMLKVREVVTFAATATLSNGSNAAVTNWTSDAATVATVTSAGAVTGVAAGKATLTAEYQGKTGTRLVRVVPDYQGTWTGIYRIGNCSADGGFGSTWCNGKVGLTAPYTLTLSQTRDTVSGTVAFGSVTGSTSGPVGDAGTLTLSGTAVAGDLSMTIANWNTNSTSYGSMTGTFQTRMTSKTLSGSALHTCELLTATKGVATQSFGFALPDRNATLTLDELARALGLER